MIDIVFLLFGLVIAFHLLLAFEYWRKNLVSNKCSEEKDRISLRFFCLSSKKELVIERYRSCSGLGLRGCLLSSTPRLDHLVHIATTIWTASFFLKHSGLKSNFLMFGRHGNLSEDAGRSDNARGKALSSPSFSHPCPAAAEAATGNDVRVIDCAFTQFSRRRGMDTRFSSHCRIRSRF